MELNYVISITDRDQIQELAGLFQSLELNMGLIMLGKGTATSEQLSIYGLSNTEKAIVSTVASAEGTRQLIRAAKRKLYMDIPGNGIMLTIPIKSVGGGRTLAYLTGNKTPSGGAPDLHFEHELIIAVLNAGYSSYGNHKGQLNLWNNELSATAARIIKKRLAALKELLVIASGIYASIAGGSESMLINYALKTSNDFILQQSDKSESEWQEFYLKELHERQALDILRGNTSIGPHRDDLFFYVSGKLLKAFGSQGQQRSAALALKLAQLEYVKNNTGEYPVLLLDDVMSELDSERRTHLLKFIDGRVQTFITVNDKHLIPDLNNNAYFYIENGKVMQG